MLLLGPVCGGSCIICVSHALSSQIAIIGLWGRLAEWCVSCCSGSFTSHWLRQMIQLQVKRRWHSRECTREDGAAMCSMVMVNKHTSFSTRSHPPPTPPRPHLSCLLLLWEHTCQTSQPPKPQRRETPQHLANGCAVPTVIRAAESQQNEVVD